MSKRSCVFVVNKTMQGGVLLHMNTPMAKRLLTLLEEQEDMDETELHALREQLSNVITSIAEAQARRIAQHDSQLYQ